jgi:hypothetical protein
MRKSDGKLHRERSANKNLFRTSRPKAKRPTKSLGWFFGKSGEKKYLLESAIIVHAKGK